jgi:tetratricopeptide (TPR) repeat protein
MPKSTDRTPHQPAKPAANPAKPTIDPESVAAALAQIPSIAAAVRAATDRAAMLDALAPLTRLPERELSGVATALGNQRGDQASEAVDVAEALAELALDRGAAKEARRAVIRLRSAGIRPTITVPKPLVALEAPGTTAPEFIQGWASRTRERSEVYLGLVWTRPGMPQDVDGYFMKVNLWEGHIDEITHAETSQRRFERDLLTPAREKEHFTWANVTLPQARALIESALDQGAWRGEAPTAAWTEIGDLILRRVQQGDEAPDQSVHAALIDPEADPEETLVNFWGTWSFGDYTLAYELLSERHALRERETRDEFVALRRQWHGEAKAIRLQVGAVTPQAQEQSGLWLPGTATASANRQNYAFYWSLELQETPIAGQLTEMPLATLVNPDTSRHWYWQSITMEREAARGWRIGRIRDEALAAQTQPVDDLMQRSDAIWAEAEAAAEQDTAHLKEDAAREAALRVLTLAQESLSRGEVALMRMSLDRMLYEKLHDRAAQIGAWDRAAAITHRMLTHFPDKGRFYRDLSSLDFRKAQTLLDGGDEVGYQRWLEFSLVAARNAVAEERTAETLVILAELLIARQEFDEAEQLLRESLGMAETVGAWADLGDLLMRQKQYKEAISAFERAQKLDPQSPQVRWRLGRALELADRKPEARMVYEEALTVDETDAMAHALLGNIQVEQNELNEAAKHLTRAVQLGLVSAQIYVQLGYIASQAGQFQVARELLEQAIRIDPTITDQVKQLIAQVRSEEERAKRQKR